MVLMRVSVSLRMIMPHEPHHEDVGKRAQKNHAVEQHAVERHLEDIHCRQPDHGNETAQEHQQHVGLLHGYSSRICDSACSANAGSAASQMTRFWERK